MSFSRPRQSVRKRERGQPHRFHDVGEPAEFHEQRAARAQSVRGRGFRQPHMAHLRQGVGEEQFSDRRFAADPAQEPGLPPLDQRGVEQRLFIDRIAGARARQNVGDDRIGLGKG